MSALSLAGAARHLRKSRATVKQLAETGVLPARKVETGGGYRWEFYTGALDAWEDEQGRLAARKAVQS